MKIIQTPLVDCFVIEPTIFEDERGFFYESYNKRKFKQLVGIDANFVQDNCSYSTKGVLRGLHLQKGKYAQAKLVQAIQGEVLDVVVDLRRKSTTYAQYYSILLNEKNKKQLFVPRGFAHGFVVLSQKALFYYKCDNFYNKTSESGVIYNDTFLNIDWKLPKEKLIVSPKDMQLPTFENLCISLY